MFVKNEIMLNMARMLLIAIFILLSNVFCAVVVRAENKEKELSPAAERILNKKLINVLNCCFSQDGVVAHQKSGDENENIEVTTNDFEKQNYIVGVLYGWRHEIMFTGEELERGLPGQIGTNVRLPSTIIQVFYSSRWMAKGVGDGRRLAYEWKEEIRADLVKNSKKSNDEIIALVLKSAKENIPINTLHNKTTEEKKNILFETSPSLEALMFLYRQLCACPTVGSSCPCPPGERTPEKGESEAQTGKK